MSGCWHLHDPWLCLQSCDHTLSKSECTPYISALSPNNSNDKSIQAPLHTYTPGQGGGAHGAHHPAGAGPPDLLTPALPCARGARAALDLRVLYCAAVLLHPCLAPNQKQQHVCIAWHKGAAAGKPFLPGLLASCLMMLTYIYTRTHAHTHTSMRMHDHLAPPTGAAPPAGTGWGGRCCRDCCVRLCACAAGGCCT